MTTGEAREHETATGEPDPEAAAEARDPDGTPAAEAARDTGAEPAGVKRHHRHDV